MSGAEYQDDFEQKSHVGLGLLSYLLGFSFIVTVIASSFVLYSDYRRGVDQYQKNLDQINASYQQSVSYSLWNFDNRQIESQLAGILNFPGVVYVYIESRDKLVQSAGDIYSPADLQYSFRLTHQSASQEYHLGNLYINVNYTGLYDDLKHRALTIVMTQFVKTFSVSIFLLILVRMLITRRLDAMARWANGFSLSNLDTPLRLSDSRPRYDELDMVADAINRMRDTLKQDALERERAREQLVETKEQLTVAIDNASLGFARYLPESDHMQCNNHFARHLATSKQELEALPRAMEQLRDMIRGLKGPEQREKLNQLMLGRISRVHGEFTMANFRNEKCYFDITMQTIQFSEARPREVLICLVDKTREHAAVRQATELATSLENKVTERTEQLYHEQQKAKESVRKLETRLQRSLRQSNSQAANEFKELLLNEFDVHYPKGQPLPGRLETLREYLKHCLDDERVDVDLPEMVNRVLQTSESLSQLRTVTKLPFSLVVSEPAGILEFLLRCVMDNEPAVKHCDTLNFTLQLQHNRADITCVFSGKNNLPALEPHPYERLCAHILQARFNGTLTRTQEDEQVTLSFGIALDQ